MALSKVNMPESSSTFSVLDVGFENGARTFSLSPDHTSHGELKMTVFVTNVLCKFARDVFIDIMQTTLCKEKVLANDSIVTF